MKIAVTYENGNVFEHFGHVKQFAIYEVENHKCGEDHQGCAGNGSCH